MGKAWARVFISGRVQGVFFRAHTREKAESLGLEGWVRNLPDGRVEALFGGSRDRVEDALAWCHRGAPPSRVDRVEVSWEEPAEQVAGFSIRR